MRSNQTATIAINASLSDSIDMADGSLVGIIMPAAWTAGGLHIAGSVDGTNFYPLFDTAGNELGVTSAVASYMYTFDPGLAVPPRYIKIRSGTAGTPVVQLAARTFTVIGRRFD
jgi:hypothetical protein